MSQCRLESSVDLARNQANLDWNFNVNWFTLKFQCKLDYFQFTLEFQSNKPARLEYLKIILTIPT